MKETKEMLSFVFSLTEGVFKALEDGKFGLTDIVHFIETIKGLPSAVNDIALVVEEIKAMDVAQKEELKVWIKEDFDIPAEGVEATVEAGLSIILDLFGLWGNLKAAK